MEPTQAFNREGVRADTRAAETERAIRAAADLLLGARLPLIFGLTDSTVEAQRAAVELADLLGAAVDPSTSASHGPSMLAFQNLGRVTASFGEVRNRADVVVFWGVDPERQHPGFLQRYVAPAPGAPPRAELAVDVGEARAPDGIALRVEVVPEREIEALWALRAMLRGRSVSEDEETLGASPDALRALAGQLGGAGYGILFFDGDPPPERRDRLRAVALTQLVMEANRSARLRMIGIRVPGSPVGAENVLAWQTGYPFAVHFGRGYPRFGPAEFTGEALLARGDADAALLVGSNAEHVLTPAAREGLDRIPRVLIGAARAEDFAANIVFKTTPPEQTPGSHYRMDGAGLRRPPETADREHPTEEEVLARLVARVRERLIGSPQ